MGGGVFIVVDPEELPPKKIKMEKKQDSRDDNGWFSNINSQIENKSPPIRIPVVSPFIPNPYTSRGNQFFNG